MKGLIKLPGCDVDQFTAAARVQEWIRTLIGTAADLVRQVKSRPVLGQRNIARQRTQHVESVLEVTHGIRIVRVLCEGLTLRGSQLAEKYNVVGAMAIACFERPGGTPGSVARGSVRD